MNYQGKVAVITGGGGGIGYGIALACAKEGMKLVLSDISKDRLEQNAARLSKDTGVDILTVIADVTSEADLQALAQKTLDRFGSVDLLFNNAGIHFHKSFDLLTDKDWEWTLKTNLWSVIYGLRTFIPIMEKQGGPCTIINIASSAAVSLGAPTMVHYSATKHAVKALTEGVLNELRIRQSNVDLMLVMPEFVTTNLMKSAAEIRPPQFRNNEEVQSALDKMVEERFVEGVRGSVEMHTMSAEEAGVKIMEGLKQGKNYVFTHEQTGPTLMATTKSMLEAGKLFSFS